MAPAGRSSGSGAGAPAVPSPVGESGVEKPLITVCICTHNRAELLARCLESLVDQSADSSAYRVFIINNNSTDNTAQVSERFTARYPFVKYFEESAPGLSNARNCAIANAVTPYMGFIDDDAYAVPNWIEVAITVIRTHRPKIFFGKVISYHAGEHPGWYKNLGPDATVGNIPDGWHSSISIQEGNSFVDLAHVRRLGGFNPERGTFSDHKNYHEGKDLVDKSKAAGHLVYFANELAVYHLVDPSRYVPFFYMQEQYLKGYETHVMETARGDYSKYTTLPGATLYAETKQQIKKIMQCISEQSTRVQPEDVADNTQKILTDTRELFWKLGYLVSASDTKTSKAARSRTRRPPGAPSRVRVPNRFITDHPMSFPGYLRYHVKRQTGTPVIGPVIRGAIHAWYLLRSLLGR